MQRRRPAPDTSFGSEQEVPLLSPTRQPMVAPGQTFIPNPAPVNHAASYGSPHPRSRPGRLNDTSMSSASQNGKPASYFPVGAQISPTHHRPGAGMGRLSPSASYISLNSPLYQDMGNEDVGRWLYGVGRDSAREAWQGLVDALSFQRSATLVLSDAELRANVLKSCLINLISLLSVWTFDNLLLPLLSSTPTPSHHGAHYHSPAETTKQVGALFNLFFKYPVFGFCFWINASWNSRISKRALHLQDPAFRPQESQMSHARGSALDGLLTNVLASLPRFCLILDHTLMSMFLARIPFLGGILAFCYACLVNSFYSFDFSFSSRGWSMPQVATKISRDLSYYMAFGMMPTLVCGHGPPLVGMAIFALIYPLFVIQALQARRSGQALEDDLLETGMTTPVLSPTKGMADDDGSIFILPGGSTRPSSPLPGQHAKSMVSIPGPILRLLPPKYARQLPFQIAAVRDTWLFYLARNMLRYVDFIKERHQRYLNRRNGAHERDRLRQRAAEETFGMGIVSGMQTDAGAQMTHRHL